MIHYRTLSDYVAEYQNIFDTRDSESMTRLFSATQTQMSTELDLLYGSLFVNIHSTGDSTADIANLRLKTSLVYNMMLEKYTKMQSLFAIDYEPLENYNMIENGTTSSTGTGGGTSESTDSGTNTEVRDLATSYTSTGQDTATGSNTITYDTSDTVTHNTSDTTTFGRSVATTGNTSSTLNNTSTDTVAPFDSEVFFNNTQTTGATSNTGTDTSSVVNSGQDSTKVTGTDTTAHTGTEGTSSSSTTDTTKTDSGTNTGSVETTNSTQSSASYSDSKSENGTHTLTRHGNIGVTTSQQMLQSELDLIPRRQLKFEFYNDIKQLILIGIYC